eukprot:jgi/Psemu1/310241/fgenesh1_kg.608_\
MDFTYSTVYEFHVMRLGLKQIGTKWLSSGQELDQHSRKGRIPQRNVVVLNPKQILC